MKFQSRKAQKRQLALKILCSGSSGSGKTKSALRLATGIVSKTGGSIYLINTEGDRGEMYANEFDYQILTDLYQKIHPYYLQKKQLF